MRHAPALLWSRFELSWRSQRWCGDFGVARYVGVGNATSSSVVKSALSCSRRESPPSLRRTGERDSDRCWFAGIAEFGRAGSPSPSSLCRAFRRVVIVACRRPLFPALTVLSARSEESLAAGSSDLRAQCLTPFRIGVAVADSTRISPAMRKRAAIAMGGADDATAADTAAADSHAVSLAPPLAFSAAGTAHAAERDTQHTTHGIHDGTDGMDERGSRDDASAAASACHSEHPRCHATNTAAPAAARPNSNQDGGSRSSEHTTYHIAGSARSDTPSPPPPGSSSSPSASSILSSSFGRGAAQQQPGQQLRLGLDASAPNTAPSTPKRRPSPSARTPHSVLAAAAAGKPPTSPATSSIVAAVSADPRSRVGVTQRIQRWSTMGQESLATASATAGGTVAVGSSSSPCSPKLGFKPSPGPSSESHTPLRLGGSGSASSLLAVRLMQAATSPPGSFGAASGFGFGFAGAANNNTSAAFNLDFHVQDTGNAVPSGSTSSHHSHSNSSSQNGGSSFSPFSSPILASSRGSPLASSAHLHTPPAAPPPMLLGLPVPDFTNTEQARHQSPALRNRTRLQSGNLTAPPPTPQQPGAAGSSSSHSIGRSLISSFGHAAPHHSHSSSSSSDRDAASTSQPMSAAEPYSVLSSQHHSHASASSYNQHHASSVSMPSTPSRGSNQFKRRLVEKQENEKEMKLFSFVSNSNTKGVQLVAPVTAAHSYSIAKAAAAAIAAMPRSPLFSSTAQPGDPFSPSRSLRVSRSPGLMPASSSLLSAPPLNLGAAASGLPPNGPSLPMLMPPPSSPPMRPRSHSLALGLGLGSAFSATGSAAASAASSFTPPQSLCPPPLPASAVAAAAPVPLLQSSSRFLPFHSYTVVSKLGSGSFGDVFHVRVEREEWAQNHYPSSLLPSASSVASAGAPVLAPVMLDFALKKSRVPFKSLLARNRVIHQYNLLFSMWIAPAPVPAVLKPVSDDSVSTAAASSSSVSTASAPEPSLSWHPHLVPLHAVWQEAPGLLYEVMDLCPAPSWPFRALRPAAAASSGSATLEEFFICLREGVERRARGQLPEPPRVLSEPSSSGGAFKTPGQDEEDDEVAQDAGAYRSPGGDLDSMTDEGGADDRSSCNTVNSPPAVASALSRPLLQFPLVAAPVFEGGVHPCERELWRVIAQIGSALAHLHAHRILHFDVKPGNIFCMEAERAETENEGEGQSSTTDPAQIALPKFLYKLGDFGSVVSLTDYIHGGGNGAAESFEAQEGDGDFLAPEVLNPLPCMKPPSSSSQQQQERANQMLFGPAAGAHGPEPVADDAETAAAKEVARLALARELAPRVDVFSLGMSLFSIITGRLLGRQLVTPTECSTHQQPQEDDDGSMHDAAPAGSADRPASPEVPRMRHYFHGDTNAQLHGSDAPDLFAYLQFPVSAELRALVEHMLEMDPRQRPSMASVVERATAMVREHEKQQQGRQQQVSDSSSAAASSSSAIVSHASSGEHQMHDEEEDDPVTPVSNAAPIHPVDVADHALLSSPLKRSSSDPNTHRTAEMMQVLRMAASPPGSGSNGATAAESKARAAERQSSSPLHSSKSFDVLSPAAAATAVATGPSSGGPSSPMVTRRGPRSLFPASATGVDAHKQQHQPSPGSSSPPVRSSFSGASSTGGGSSSSSSTHSASNSIGGFPHSNSSGAPSLSMSSSGSECSSNATSPPVSTTNSPQLSGITSSLSISNLSLPVLAAFVPSSSAAASSGGSSHHAQWSASFNAGSADGYSGSNGSRALLSMGFLQPSTSSSPSVSPSPPRAPTSMAVARSAHAPMVGSGRMPVKRSSLHVTGSRASSSAARGGGRGGASTVAGAHQPLSAHARNPSQRSQSLFSTLTPAAPTPASKDTPRVPGVLPMDDSVAPRGGQASDMDVEPVIPQSEGAT